MKTILSAIAVVLAILIVASASHITNAADSKSGNSGGQRKELTEDDAKQMIKDLNDLKKLHQEFKKKMMEFQQKYGMMPDLGMGMGPGGQGGQSGQGGNMGPGGQGGMGPGGKPSKPSDNGANSDFPQPNF